MQHWSAYENVFLRARLSLLVLARSGAGDLRAGIDATLASLAPPT